MCVWERNERERELCCSVWRARIPSSKWWCLLFSNPPKNFCRIVVTLSRHYRQCWWRRHCFIRYTVPRDRESIAAIQSKTTTVELRIVLRQYKSREHLEFINEIHHTHSPYMENKSPIKHTNTKSNRIWCICFSDFVCVLGMRELSWSGCSSLSPRFPLPDYVAAARRIYCFSGNSHGVRMA